MFQLPTDIRVTEVTKAFKDKAQEILEKRQQSVWQSYRLQQIEKRLTPLGLDRMWTSLRKLNYVKYSCLKAPDGDIFLCGETDDLIFDLRDGSSWNAGHYYVCISEESILSDQLRDIHVFPKRAPRIYARHLHHGCYERDNASLTHPLMANESTCWGSVSGSYVSALQVSDIVDLFRIMYIFCIRLDWSSPLFSGWVNELRRFGERL